jgi:hypothetical protein
MRTGVRRDRPRAGRSGILPCLLGLSAAVLLGGCAIFFTPQKRYLVAEKNRREVPTHYEPLTFGEFLTLPALPESYGESDWELVRAHTGRAVSLEGYIAEVRRAPDGWNYGRPFWEGDIHLHLREAPQCQCFPDGPRGGQIVTEVTPHFQNSTTGWDFETLWNLCQRQVRVRLSGWLLHDYQHLDAVGRWRASAWEIHPVTKIEVWDPAGQTWRPLP